VYSSFESEIEEAATFSSRWSRLPVPGIGSVTSECSSNHASATWYDCGVVCVGHLLDGVNSRDRPDSEREVGNEADAVVLTSVEDILVVTVQYVYWFWTDVISVLDACCEPKLRGGRFFPIPDVVSVTGVCRL